MTRRRRARAHLLGALAAAGVGVVLLGGCRTDVEVLVHALKDGSGSVVVHAVLDDDAAASLGTTLAVDDLEAKGWAVKGPALRGAGGVEITAERRFANTAQAQQTFRMLSGPGGPLPTFTLRRTTGLLRRTLRLDGVADLSAGLASFGDADIQATLGSPSRLGLADETVAAQAGTSLGKAFRFRVSTQLDDAPPKIWAVPLGQRVAIHDETSRTTWSTVGFAAVAILGLVGGGVLWWIGRRPRDAWARR